MIFIWSCWCHCHAIVSYFIKIQIGLITFLMPAYPGFPCMYLLICILTVILYVIDVFFQIPCKHVFCYSCAKTTDKNCPRLVVTELFYYKCNGLGTYRTAHVQFPLWNSCTPWAIKRSQLIVVCNIVKYWCILMQFSLLYLKMNDVMVWSSPISPN